MAPAPRLSSAVRSALSDFFFNSGRLVPVNVLWGATVVLIVLVGFAWPFGALLLLPLLALPTVAVFRVAARIVRDDGDVSFRDAVAACRDYAVPALVIGVGYVDGTVVLLTNLVVGLTGTDPLGWVLGTFAAWGLLVLWCGATALWPLLVDPRLAARPIPERLRLAGLVLIAHPGRMTVLGAFVAIVTVVSTILAAAILTISVAFIALVACRVVLPAAERLDLQVVPAARS